MKSYSVAKFSPDAFSWESVKAAPIDCWVWSRAYTPACEARAAVVGDELRFRLSCAESSPKATFKSFFDDVYLDSCLEVFFSFSGGGYINCEMNALGTFLSAYGPDRFSRVRLDSLAPLPKVSASVGDGVWTVEARFSSETLEKVFGSAFSLEPGKIIRANFYKCGDETAVPHYGSWNPIGVSQPDFHRPEFFGELVIE